MSKWTPERIAELRGDPGEIATVQEALYAALDEIERLQASCIEYRAELSEQDATIKRLQDRDQRRERLLRECVTWIEDDGPRDRRLATRIRAELEGGR